jgi:hypothetical protein
MSVDAPVKKPKTDDPHPAGADHPEGHGAVNEGGRSALAAESVELRTEGRKGPGTTKPKDGSGSGNESVPSSLDLAVRALYEQANPHDARRPGSITNDAGRSGSIPNDAGRLGSIPKALHIDGSGMKELYKNPTLSDHFRLKEARDALVSSMQNSSDVQRDGRTPDNLKGFEDQARKRGLSEAEITDTYKALNEMLNADDRTSATNKQERALALTSFLDSVAHTDKTDQGAHNTCNVTTLRDKEIEEHPAQAAARLRDLTVKGGYLSEGVNGEQDCFVKLDRDSLHPDKEARNPTDGKRNYFGQLSDLALVNDYWQRRGLQYTQRPQDVGAFGRRDTGERLRRLSDGRELTDGNGKPIDHPCLDSERLNKIGERMGFRDFIYTNASLDPQSDVGKLNTEKAFAERLQKGAFTMFVDSGHPLYSGAVGEGGQGGGHVVRVSQAMNADGTERKGWVHVDNSWGSNNDSDVPIDVFFDSTKAKGGERKYNTRQELASSPQYREWQQSGGDRMLAPERFVPNEVLTHEQFVEHYNHIQKQLKTELYDRNDVDHKAPERNTPDELEQKRKEFLAKREEDLREQEKQDEQKEQLARLQKLLMASRLQSELDYAKSSATASAETLARLATELHYLAAA